MLQYDRPPMKSIYLMSVDGVAISANSSWRMCYLAMMARYATFGHLVKVNHTYTYDSFVWECLDGERECVVIEEMTMDAEYFIPDAPIEGMDDED